LSPVAAHTKELEKGMAAIGVDGCKGGWVFFRLDADEEPAFGVVTSLSVVVDGSVQGDRILADVPIGLLDQGPGERLCDLESRQLLGPGGRGRSVFPVPCREAVYALDYKEATRLNLERLGRGLSRQSWGLVRGIREADQLMRTSDVARARMCEAHPELLFWAMAGQRPMEHSKKTQEGLLERVDLLEQVYPGAEELAAAAFVAHGGFRVARDDVVDALAASVAARLSRPLTSLPGDPPLDAFGIPMQMVYPSV